MWTLCCNLSLGLMTKARACKGVGQEWSSGVTFHAPRNVGKCEGMNPTFPSEPPLCVTTPLLEECEDETHTSKMGTCKSIGTFETSEFNYRGQNTSPWGVIYIIEKLSNRRCRKWACMSHLKICSTSYGKKKGRKSNYQFDSQPLKVGNRPDLDTCRWNATHRWKALDEKYKFASDLTPIEGLNKNL
jgi:hypothetical protein